MSQENFQQPNITPEEGYKKITFEDLKKMMLEKTSESFKKDVMGRFSEGGNVGPVTEEKRREFITEYGLPENITRDDIQKINENMGEILCRGLVTELELPKDTSLVNIILSEENQKKLIGKLNLPENATLKNIGNAIIKKYYNK